MEENPNESVNIEELEKSYMQEIMSNIDLDSDGDSIIITQNIHMVGDENKHHATS